MDVLTGCRLYVAEMVRLAGPGMKVLLMDRDTTSVVSCVYAQSEMMQREVYLFERIDTPTSREPIKHLKCVVFIRPTEHNLHLLALELRSPRYAQYYIYLSNLISKTDVKALAECDEQESVREMHEFYADFIPLAPHLFSLNLFDCYLPGRCLNPSTLRRCTQGIVAALLTLKKRALIRYQSSSPDCSALAEQVAKILVRESQLFAESGECVLLVLDRSLDPITPLLTQWTYQAMVHELLGINNNRVSLDSLSTGGGTMPSQVVLSSLHDEFFAQNLYSNFGEIGQNIKELMDQFQKKSKTHEKLESISDMKNFVESYPQFKKMSGTVSKHVSLVGELSRLVAVYNLLELSEVEQEMVYPGSEHSQCLQNVRRLLAHEKTTDLDGTRLVMLYALRFDQHANNDIQGLTMLLRKKGVPDKYVQSIRGLLELSRSRGLRSSTTSTVEGIVPMAAAAKRLFRGLKGVENVYTQHEPLLTELLEQVIRSRLSETAFPMYPLPPNVSTSGGPTPDVLVFIIGGVTYEESLAIHRLNTRLGARIVLAGSAVHNARSFIDQVIASR